MKLECTPPRKVTEVNLLIVVTELEEEEDKYPQIKAVSNMMVACLNAVDIVLYRQYEYYFNLTESEL